MTRAHVDTAAWLDSAMPIGLAELDAAAALQTRVDRKYVLSLAALDEVGPQLVAGSRVLTIAGQRRAAYASLYYDTPGLDSYHLTARSRRRRFKVRRRTYLDTGACFLEVKTRGPRGATVKERICQDPSTPEATLGDDAGFVTAVLERAGVVDVDAQALVPVLRTTYRRVTLYTPAAGTRTTIDTELCWSTCEDQVLPVLGVAIVETKSGTAPSPADRCLWAAGHRPARISKYATGMAVLRGDLPDNRWNRVVTRELAMR